MIHAILFDFNGVVIDDEAIHFRAYRELFAKEGVTLTEEQYYAAVGLDDVTFAFGVMKEGGKSPSREQLDDLIERKTALHRTSIEDEIPFFPGVVTFIKAAAREFELGLVSMSRRVEIEYVLERARLRDQFTAVVSAEDVHVPKPEPDCYQLALKLINESRQVERKLPLLRNECLVIEDAPRGIQSGKSAGMKTLGLTNTVSEEVLRDAGADVVSSNLADWNVDAVRHVFS